MYFHTIPKKKKPQKKPHKKTTTPHTQNTLWPFHSLLPMEKDRLYLIFQLEGRVADSFQWGGDFLPTFRTHPFPKIRPPGQAAQREQTQLWASAVPTSLPFPFTPSGLGMAQGLGESAPPIWTWPCSHLSPSCSIFQTNCQSDCPTPQT